MTMGHYHNWNSIHKNPGDLERDLEPRRFDRCGLRQNLACIRILFYSRTLGQGKELVYIGYQSRQWSLPAVNLVVVFTLEYKYGVQGASISSTIAPLSTPLFSKCRLNNNQLLLARVGHSPSPNTIIADSSQNLTRRRKVLSLPIRIERKHL